MKEIEVDDEEELKNRNEHVVSDIFYFITFESKVKNFLPERTLLGRRGHYWLAHIFECLLLSEDKLRILINFDI